MDIWWSSSPDESRLCIFSIALPHLPLMCKSTRRPGTGLDRKTVCIRPTFRTDFNSIFMRRGLNIKKNKIYSREGICLSRKYFGMVISTFFLFNKTKNGSICQYTCKVLNSMVPNCGFFYDSMPESRRGRTAAVPPLVSTRASMSTLMETSFQVEGP